jgi:hypothetical protein
MERYGIILTRNIEDSLVRLIQNPISQRNQGEVICIEKVSGNVTNFQIWCKEFNRWLFVGYDKHRHQISSLLPPDATDLPTYIPSTPTSPNS